jgi:transcriptional regulator with XRE-family HTH domain
MPDSFGARLRQQREARHVDLLAIASQTRIKLALLEALERDDVSHWPAGIFRRAYFRTYAEFIGLDPDVALREFLEIHPDPESIADALAAAAEAARRNSPPPTRLRTFVDSAIGSLAKLRPPALERARPAEASPNEAPPAPVVPEPATPPAVASSQGEPADTRLPEPAAFELKPPDPDAAGRVLEPEAESTLETIAHLCTEFGRAADRSAIQPLLQASAAALNATGLVVWHWDEVAGALKPALVHGYSEKVLAHLPAVRPESDNVTAASFRSANTREIAATAHTSGALVIPLLVPEGCAGVLALEIPEGVQPTRSARAAATLLAAALAQLVRRSRPPEVTTQIRSA